MTVLITLVTILQSFAISLGVGSSTLAITNFFVAIADGKIDDTERRMMGVVYIVLRIAMGLILATTIFLVATEYGQFGIMGINNFAYAQLMVLAVIFVNAILMTAHLVPSTIGPGLQAGSWYTLGTLSALALTANTDFSLLQFSLAFITWLVLAISIVNAVMAILMYRRNELP